MMHNERKNTNIWPNPPTNSRGISQPWIVATLEFQRAAQIELQLSAPQNEKIHITDKQGDQRYCSLAGFYDDDYNSFHLFRYFEDDQNEPIYNPSTSKRSINYKEILTLMKEWQEIAAGRTPVSGRESTALTHIRGFDPLLYKQNKPHNGL